MLLVALGVAALVGAWAWHGSASRPLGAVPPYEYMAPEWNEVLTSPAGLDEAAVGRLAAFSGVPSAEDSAELRSLAQEVLEADLTGTGRAAFDGYWPPVPEGGTSPPLCSHVDVAATSPALLPHPPGGDYAKVVVVWDGECGREGDPHDHSGGAEFLRTAFVYAAFEGDSWVPVREWEVPRPVEEDIRVSAPPLAAELAPVLDCAGSETGEVARIVVVEAWRQLCEHAAAEGVTLSVHTGLRTAEEQEDLFEGAGEAHSQRIAFSDGRTCDSKHCDGTALDLSGAEGVLWLQDVVGCLQSGEAVLGPSSCPTGEPVRRLHRYGFVSPDPSNLAHVEFALPVGGRQVANCAPSRAVPVPDMVAQIFRCRLAREQVDPEQTASAVAEALVVSRCESLWNARALALDGRFRNAPHPVTGQVVSEAGVFMLPDSLGKWAPSGADRLDPVQNINAAASLWLASRDWSQWPCATGRRSSYASGPVLPQYGGPELPSWSLEY